MLTCYWKKLFQLRNSSEFHDLEARREQMCKKIQQVTSIWVRSQLRGAAPWFPRWTRERASVQEYTTVIWFLFPLFSPVLKANLQKKTIYNIVNVNLLFIAPAVKIIFWIFFIHISDRIGESCLDQFKGNDRDRENSTVDEIAGLKCCLFSGWPRGFLRKLVRYHIHSPYVTQRFDPSYWRCGFITRVRHCNSSQYLIVVSKHN